GKIRDGPSTMWGAKRVESRGLGGQPPRPADLIDDLFPFGGFAGFFLLNLFLEIFRFDDFDLGAFFQFFGAGGLDDVAGHGLGGRPARPRSPAARLAGTYNSYAAPSFISCMPSVQPGMTRLSWNLAGSPPRLSVLSKTVPSISLPVYFTETSSVGLGDSPVPS